MESSESLVGFQEACPNCGTINVVPQIPQGQQPLSQPPLPQEPLPNAGIPQAPSSNPYASPQGSPAPTAPVMPGYAAPAPPVAITTAYAGFWLRCVALIIDLVIMVALVFACAFFVGIVLGIAMAAAGAEVEQIEKVAEPIAFVLWIIVPWLYFAVMECSGKMATLGKMALRLVVTDMSGGRISFVRATGRNCGKIISVLILGIGFFMSGFTQRKQALHDMMATCLVLRRKSAVIRQYAY